MADIFVSYSRKDLSDARRLVEALVQEGWRCFWDVSLNPGETWRDRILAELEEARCVIVLWSSTSVSSRWVLGEAERALRADKLVPVILDGTPPPFGLDEVQAIDLKPWCRQHADEELTGLIRSLDARIGLPPASEATAGPSAVKITVEVDRDLVMLGETAECKITIDNPGPDELRLLILREHDRITEEPFDLKVGRTRHFTSQMHCDTAGTATRPFRVHGISERGQEVEAEGAAVVRVADPESASLAIDHVARAALVRRIRDGLRGPWTLGPMDAPGSFHTRGPSGLHVEIFEGMQAATDIAPGGLDAGVRAAVEALDWTEIPIYAPGQEPMRPRTRFVWPPPVLEDEPSLSGDEPRAGLLGRLFGQRPVVAPSPVEALLTRRAPTAEELAEAVAALHVDAAGDDPDQVTAGMNISSRW